MFEDDLFAYVLELLAQEIVSRPTPPPNPLAVDSYIARSIMQKAIRRGMTDLALRAAAQLMVLDRRVLWRRLLVTALEDLGPGEAELMARIAAAHRDRAWRERLGGDWPVATELIQQACEGTRCQSANDLWNVAKNEPGLDTFKAGLCDTKMDDLLAIMTDETCEIGERGVAVLLAIGEDAGPAAPDHIKPDPTAVFEAFAQAGHFSHVAVSYREAYRQSRLALSPLGLCLWPQSAACEPSIGRDDDLPSVKWTGQTPTFALDQYTRMGKAAVRRYVAQSERWRAFTTTCGVPSRDHAAAAGELLFRAEGARVTKRRQWNIGLALYALSEPQGCYLPPSAVRAGLTLIRSELPLIDQLRIGPSLTSHPDQGAL